MEISVIIPTFNDEVSIKKTLTALSRLQNISEVIVVDGKSTDKTLETVENYKEIKNLKLIKFTEANRGRQLHAGTKEATGEIFWFIHAGARPVQGSGRQIKALMRYREVVGGNFRVTFEGKSRRARFLTWLYSNLRTTGIVYGETAIFARRETYEKIRGFKPFPVLEDVDFAKRLQKRGRFVHINLPITVMNNRFDNKKYSQSFVGWSFFQGLLWIGVPARLLAKGYRQIR